MTAATHPRVSAAARPVLDERIRLVVETLDGAPSNGDDLAAALAVAVGTDPARLWLAWSVLAAGYPTDGEMRDALRRLHLSDVWTALAPAVAKGAGTGRDREVQVVSGGVTCEVTVTSRTNLLSGIQRVVRAVAGRWNAAHDVTFLAWARDFHGMCRLTLDEEQSLFVEPRAVKPAPAPLVIPWQCTHIVPELLPHLKRTDLMHAFARLSGNTVVAIGYDCIPITSARTVTPGMVGAFAKSLAPWRHMARIGAISDAAAGEFVGWAAMGAGRGGTRPEVATVMLPTDAHQPSDEAVAEAERLMRLGSRPVVLVVGSHEPRKNHLAVLHAAEVLWQEGLDFTLSLVGAAAWKSEAYEAEVERLMALGRPLQSVRGLSDHLLWAAYQVAHCSVFPSLNEGFGLPVAESLASGTPVITSNFGSMRDLVDIDGVSRGGLLIDPRDDESIIDALRTMLSDDVTYARLRAETTQRPARTWAEYADELWAYLIDGHPPA